MYDKRVDFDFDIVNFHLLDGDIPSAMSHAILYVSYFVLQEHLITLATLPTLSNFTY